MVLICSVRDTSIGGYRTGNKRIEAVVAIRSLPTASTGSADRAVEDVAGALLDEG